MIEQGRKFSKDLKEPKKFIIYQKGKKVQVYGKTAIDNIIQRFAQRAGIQRRWETTLFAGPVLELRTTLGSR